MKKRRFLRNGSFTVEAAVVVPLVIILLAALIGLTFFEHDRVWYTGAACEAALAANAAADKEEAAKRKIEQKEKERVLPGAAPDVKVETGERRTIVTYCGHRDLTMLADLSLWNASVEIRLVRPAVDLRNWWAIKRFGKEIAGWDI